MKYLLKIENVNKSGKKKKKLKKKTNETLAVSSKLFAEHIIEFNTPCFLLKEVMFIISQLSWDFNCSILRKET